MVITTFGVKGVGYEVCFNTSALYKLEEITKGPASILLQKMSMGMTGTKELVQILWAGLEGGRLYRKQQRGPWTLEETMALVDDAGGSEVFFDTEGPIFVEIVKAWEAAFPVTHKKVEDARKAQQAVEDAAARPTGTTGGSTGTGSSTKHSSTASSRKRSGGSRSTN